MDHNLEEMDMQRHIMQATQQVSGVHAVSDLKVRSSGPFVHVIAAVAVDPDLSLAQATQICDSVKLRLTTDFKAIQTAVVVPVPVTYNNKDNDSKSNLKAV